MPPLSSPHDVGQLTVEIRNLFFQANLFVRRSFGVRVVGEESDLEMEMMTMMSNHLCHAPHNHNHNHKNVSLNVTVDVHVNANDSDSHSHATPMPPPPSCDTSTSSGTTFTTSIFDPPLPEEHEHDHENIRRSVITIAASQSESEETVGDNHSLHHYYTQDDQLLLHVKEEMRRHSFSGSRPGTVDTACMFAQPEHDEAGVDDCLDFMAMNIHDPNVNANANANGDDAGGAIGSSTRDVVDADRVSVFVDPLDGTSAYAKGKYEAVTILVAIIVDNTPVFGLIVKPFNIGANLRCFKETKCSVVYGGTLLGGAYVMGGEELKRSRQWRMKMMLLDHENEEGKEEGEGQEDVFWRSSPTTTGSFSSYFQSHNSPLISSINIPVQPSPSTENNSIFYSSLLYQLLLFCCCNEYCCCKQLFCACHCTGRAKN